ncbi:EAL domain-containing protein [Pseudoalteromonas rubra]|uniref:EAL domain-containing protein n=1 Tax=Pseudoalteromonas rubra TaxID=43658 RepID=UPI000F778A7D|nr:EAL domain-containing protein [Pseudoalteromonas rubra]
MLRIILSFILIVSAFFAHAQVSRLSPAEGLSQSYVNTLLFDDNGYLWLATEGGLNRYDGYQVLEVAGPNQDLNKMQIDRIYKDDNGIIWIASGRAGLFSYDPEQDSYRRYTSAPESEEDYFKNSVFQMLSKSKHELWLGRAQNVAVMDTRTGTITQEIVLPVEDPQIAVRGLLKHDNLLFIASAERLFVYNTDTEQLRAIKHRDKITHPFQTNTKSLHLLDDDTLILGAVIGMYQLDIGALRRDFDAEVPYQTLIEELNIWQIERSGTGLLLGTDHGLMHYDIASGEVHRDTRLTRSHYAVSDNSVIYFIRDDFGGIWAATKKDGAFYLPAESQGFDNVHPGSVQGNFSKGTVWGLVEYDGYIWAGTRDGLTRYDPQTRISEQYLAGFLGDGFYPEFTIFGLLNYQDKLWLSSNRGLFVFEPGSEEIYRPQAQDDAATAVLSGFVKGAVIVGDGQLYLVDEKTGFYVFDINTQTLTKLGEEFDRFDPFLSYGFYKPLSTHPEDPVFYSEGRLFRYDTQAHRLVEIYQVPKAHKQSAVDLLSYTIDKHNVLWLSFARHGLVRLTADGYEQLPMPNEQHTVTNNILYEMVQDDVGMIWMSSHQGIWRLDPDNFHLQGFTTADGLMSNEFNGGASVKLADGRIGYGSLQGFTLFDPKVHRPTKSLLNRVNITDVDLMSRDILPSGLKSFSYIELNHDDIGLEVSFSAMAFTLQERIVYEYQLSGEQRILSRNSNRVVFPKLSPGNYRLKVWAKDPLTGDYTPPAQLEIVVHYPIWRAPWALFCYVLLAAALFAFWVHRKNKVAGMILAAHRETQNSETRLKMALEGSNSGVWDWHSGSQFVYQPRLVSDLGYDNESIVLDEYLELIHPQDRALFRIEWLEFVSTEKGFIDCTYRLRHLNGQWRWYKDYGKVMVWQDGVPVQVAGTYTNLTRERVFEERATLFGAAFEQTRDWVMIFDKHLRILACNKALQHAFSVSAAPSSSTSVTLGLDRNVRMKYLREISKLKADDLYVAEETLRLPSGEKRQVLLKISATQDKHYILVLTDISKQKRTEKELYQLANYDALTKLPNKVLFMDRVQHAIEQARLSRQPLAIIAIKFSRLQRFADTYGNDFLASVTQKLAANLQCCFREVDSLAIGNERDFYILMEQLTGVEQVMRYIHCLLERFEKGFEIEQQQVHVKAKLGIAMFPDDACDAFDLNQAAETALSHARQSLVTDYQFYHSEINEQVQRALAIEQALLKAYQEEAFRNHYQPIINATHMSVEGFEVLLRWPQDPSYSIEELAHTAEQTGIITRVMLQTLERALIDLKGWHTSHPDLYISVNLSALDFQYDDLLARITEILSRNNIDGRYLVFEITESVMMADAEQAIARMHELRTLGCRLYMDDFGTGYSSLTYLKQYPVDALKIDRSFVNDIGRDKEHEVIIHSTLSLAHSLGKYCVAEGVEQMEQLSFLRMLGCERFQGYLFSKALPADEASELLRRNWHQVFVRAS